MPHNYVYGLKIIDDLTGKFEYSPPFKIHIPASTFSSSSSETTQSTSRSISTPTSTHSRPSSSVTRPASTRTHSAEPPSSSTPSEATPSSTKQATKTSATVSSSSATSSQMASSSENDGQNMDLVYKALGGGVGGFALVVVIVAVWYRIRSENRKMAAMEALEPGKSFRDPRRSLDDDSPILEKGHNRFPSTSSFGDGARPSDLMDRPDMKPTNLLSPIADSPPPTPFAAPPLKLPSNSSQRRAEENPAHPFPISERHRNTPGPHEAPGRGWGGPRQPNGKHSHPRGPPPSSRAPVLPIPAEARSTGRGSTALQGAHGHFPSYPYTPHPPSRRDPTMDNHPT
jgi:hypothetical protein